MPERVQLRRVHGWRKPPNTVVVARPSRWGNPYRLADLRTDYPEADERMLRRFATSDFRGLVYGRWDCLEPPPPAYPSIDEIRAELDGRNLACWCPLDQPCHADVLLEIANASNYDEPSR